MRQFAANTHRSALRVVRRSQNDSYNGGTNDTVGRIASKAPRGYSSNATQMNDAAINRKRRK